MKEIQAILIFIFLNNSELKRSNPKPLRNISSYKFLTSISYLYDICWCKASIHIWKRICISKYRSCLHSFCSLKLFLQTNQWAKGYILSENISLHIFKNLCISFVTVIQYEQSILYYLGYDDSFFWIFFIFSLCIRSFLQETRFLPLSYWWSFLHVANGITYPFFFHPFLVTDLYYELNEFLVSFDGIIITPRPLFVNTFLYFLSN